MNAHAESADRRHDPSATAHLVCAYSPVWLSGPSHYEGLVATCAVADDDDAARTDGGNESGPT